MKNLKETFGNNLKLLLDSSDDMTQGKLGERINASQQTISAYCRGKSLPDVENLVEIAKVLNVSTDFLLGLDVPFSPKNVRYVTFSDCLRELVFICDAFNFKIERNEEENQPQLLFTVDSERFDATEEYQDLIKCDIYDFLCNWARYRALLEKGLISVREYKNLIFHGDNDSHSRGTEARSFKNIEIDPDKFLIQSESLEFKRK